jgi:hypothetical protein
VRVITLPFFNRCNFVQVEEILSSIAVFLMSTTKFFAGLVMALVSNDMGVIPSYLTTVGGGIIGVFAFTYFGDYIAQWFSRFFPNKKKVIFSKKSRFLVKFRRSFGLPGVAILTPLLSIPIGIVLSLSLTKNKMQIVLFMGISFALWANALLLPKYIFGLNLLEIISSIF